jgi:hypothetical protein
MVTASLGLACFLDALALSGTVAVLPVAWRLVRQLAAGGES